MPGRNASQGDAQSPFHAAQLMMQEMGGMPFPGMDGGFAMDPTAMPDWAKIPEGQGETTTKTEVWVDGKLVHSDETTGERLAALPPIVPPEPKPNKDKYKGSSKPNGKTTGQQRKPSLETPQSPSGQQVRLAPDLPIRRSLTMPIPPMDIMEGPDWSNIPDGQGETTTKTEVWVDGKLVHSDETKGGRPAGLPELPKPLAVPAEAKATVDKPKSPQSRGRQSLSKPNGKAQSRKPSSEKPNSSWGEQIPLPPDLSVHPSKLIPPMGMMEQPDWAKIPEDAEGQTYTKTEMWVDGKLVHSEESPGGRPAALGPGPTLPEAPMAFPEALPAFPGAPPPVQPQSALQPRSKVEKSQARPSVSAQSTRFPPVDEAEGQTYSKTEMWVDGKLVHSEETPGGRPAALGPELTFPEAPMAFPEALSAFPGVPPSVQPQSALQPRSKVEKSQALPSASAQSTLFPLEDVPDWSQTPEWAQLPEWAEIPEGQGKITSKMEMWVDGKLIKSEETTGERPTMPSQVDILEESVPLPSRVLPSPSSTKTKPYGLQSGAVPMPFPSMDMMPTPEWAQMKEGADGETYTKTQVWIDGKLVHSEETQGGRPVSLIPADDSKASVQLTVKKSKQSIPSQGPSFHSKLSTVKSRSHLSVTQLPTLSGQALTSALPLSSSGTIPVPAWTKAPEGEEQTHTKTEVWIDGKLVRSEETVGGPSTVISQADIPQVQPTGPFTGPLSRPELSFQGIPPMTSSMPFSGSMDLMSIPEWTKGAEGETYTKTQVWVDGKLAHSEETQGVRPMSETLSDFPRVSVQPTARGPSSNQSMVKLQGPPSVTGIPTQESQALLFPPVSEMPKPEWTKQPEEEGQTQTKTEVWIDGKLVQSEEATGRPKATLSQTDVGLTDRTRPEPSYQGLQQGVPLMTPSIPPFPSFALPSTEMVPVPEWAQIPEGVEGETYTKTQVWIDGKLVHSEETQGGRPVSLSQFDAPKVSVQTATPSARLSRTVGPPNLSKSQSAFPEPGAVSFDDLTQTRLKGQSIPRGSRPVQGSRSSTAQLSLVPSVRSILPKPSAVPGLPSPPAVPGLPPPPSDSLQASSTQPAGPISARSLTEMPPSRLTIDSDRQPGAGTTMETYYRHSSGKEHVQVWKDGQLVYSGQPKSRGPSIQMPRFDAPHSSTVETYYRHSSGKEHVQVFKDGQLVYSGQPKQRGPSVQMPRFDTPSPLFRGSDQRFFREPSVVPDLPPGTERTPSTTVETYYRHSSGKEHVQVWKDEKLVFSGQPKERGPSVQMPRFVSSPSGRNLLTYSSGRIEEESGFEMEPEKDDRFLSSSRFVTIDEEFLPGGRKPLRRVKSKYDIQRKTVSIIDRGSLYADEFANDLDQELQHWSDYSRPSAMNLVFKVQEKVKVEGSRSRFSFGGIISKSTIFASSRVLETSGEERHHYMSRANVKGIETAEKVPEITINDTAWPRHALSEHDQIYDCLLTTTVLNPAVAVLHGEHVLFRQDHCQSMRQKVKIISGGRAGLEPLFTGYVGRGMLTAAVIGDLTEVPKVQAVYSTIVELSCGGDHSAGVLMIVPNDFETRVVFGLALEQAREKNFVVEMVVVSDSVVRNPESKTKYETLSGIVLAFKLAGAMSEDGRLLKEIEWSVKSLLLASASAHILNENQSAIKSSLYDVGYPCSFKSFPDLIFRLLDLITDSRNVNSLPLTPCNKFIVMINCHDGNEICLYAAVLQVIKCLQMSGVDIERLFQGTFASGERGLTITLMKTYEKDTLQYFDALTEVSCWPRNDLAPNRYFNKMKSSNEIQAEIIPSVVDLSHMQEHPLKGPNFPEKLQYFLPYILQTVTDELIRLEDTINELDPKNSFGTAITQGFRTLSTPKSKNSPGCCSLKDDCSIDFINAHRLFSQLALAVERSSRNVHAYMLSLIYNTLSNNFLNYNDSDEVDYSMIGSGLVQAATMVKIYARIKPRQPSIADSLSELGKLLTETDTAEELDTLFEKMEKLLNKTVESSSKAIPSGKHFKGEPEPGNYTVAAIVKSIGISRKKNWSLI